MLLGNSAEWSEDIIWKRVSTYTFPASSDDDITRQFKFPTADGIILYLIKRIEKLEKQAEVKKK